MDMQAVKSAADKAKSMASGGMTEKHIFALLAYQDKAGTKEKFDAQFGKGAAEKVLAGVNDKSQGVSLTITADFNAVQEALSGIANAVANVEGGARDFAQSVGEQFSQSAARGDVLDERVNELSGEVEEMEARFEAAEQQLSGLLESLSKSGEGLASQIATLADGMTAKLDGLARDVEAAKSAAAETAGKVKALEAEMAKRPMVQPVIELKKPVKPVEEKKKPLQLRVTKRDVNDNIIAVEIVDGA